MQFFKQHKIALGIFFAALAVRLLFLPFSPFDEGSFKPDAVAFDGYYELAENILDGNGFTRSDEAPFAPDSVRTPLYPYVIVGIVWLFGSYEPLFYLQILVGSIASVLAWRIAREFLSARASLIVGLLSAVEPLTAYLSGTIMTEVLFNALFLLGTLLLLSFFKEQKMTVLGISALVLGTATLVKPTTQYIPLLLLIVLLFLHGRNVRRLAFQFSLFTALFVVVLMPWMYRNYQTFGTTSLAVQPVSNLYAYLVPSTIAFEKGISYEAAAAEFFRQENVTGIEDVTLGNAGEYKERAIAELKKHPYGLALSAGMTLWTFFTHDTYATIIDRYDVRMDFSHPPLISVLRDPLVAARFIFDTLQRPEALVLVARLLWICTALLSAYGVVRYTINYGITPKLVLIAGLVAYFAITTIVIGLSINGRFRIPVDPFIFIFAVYALETIFKKRPNRLEPVF